MCWGGSPGIGRPRTWSQALVGFRNQRRSQGGIGGLIQIAIDQDLNIQITCVSIDLSIQKCWIWYRDLLGLARPEERVDKRLKLQKNNA